MYHCIQIRCGVFQSTVRRRIVFRFVFTFSVFFFVIQTNTILNFKSILKYSALQLFLTERFFTLDADQHIIRGISYIRSRYYAAFIFQSIRFQQRLTLVHFLHRLQIKKKIEIVN